MKDNNSGKELGASTISGWICNATVESHAALNESKNLPKKVKAHEVLAVTTSLKLFSMVDLQTKDACFSHQYNCTESR